MGVFGAAEQERAGGEGVTRAEVRSSPQVIKTRRAASLKLLGDNSLFS